MNDQNGDELKDLVRQFFEAGQASSCLEDFQAAQRILEDHPAPPPDDMLIANIKAEIAMRLPLRRSQIFRFKVWETAGVAAAIALVAFLGTRFGQQPHHQGAFQQASLLPMAIWESNNIAADDADLAAFTAEVEQIRNEVVALESGDATTDADSAVTELEMQLVEINSDFWKG